MEQNSLVLWGGCGANSDLNICAIEVLATHRLLRKHFLHRQNPSSLVGDGIDWISGKSLKRKLSCTSLLSLL